MNSRETSQPFISVVIPVFNESESVHTCVSTLSEIFAHADLSSFELLFINDGSQDNTLAVLLALSAHNAHISVLNFSRNFGKEAATTAGLQYAQGDVVILMDVDLQDPPELIPQFVELWRKGHDIVYGVRAERHSDTFLKRTTANLFYRFFNYASSVHIPPHAGDFRLLDRVVVEALKQLPERNRFMKGLFAWVGFKSVGVEYERRPRLAGHSKWNYWQLWNFALDGLFSFSSSPLRLWSYIGAIFASLAFLYLVVIITRVLLFGIDTPGYASLLSVILFLGGIQLLSLGIIGEYIGRLSLEVKNRPLYLVEGIYTAGTKQPPRSHTHDHQQRV